MPDDPPGDEVPPDKLPDDDEGKGKGKEGDDKNGGGGGDDDRKEYRAGNCNDCNRQFCLDYNLPICKGAGMEDVFTTCFREFVPLSLCGFVEDLGSARPSEWIGTNTMRSVGRGDGMGCGGTLGIN